MDRHHTKTPTCAPPPAQVLLERASLGLATPWDALAAEERRSEADRRWREGVMAKVREERWSDLSPEERGLILMSLAVECVAA